MIFEVVKSFETGPVSNILLFFFGFAAVYGAKKLVFEESTNEVV